MFCPQCGKKLAGTEKFCPNCGFDLSVPVRDAATPKSAPIEPAPQAATMPPAPSQATKAVTPAELVTLTAALLMGIAAFLPFLVVSGMSYDYSVALTDAPDGAVLVLLAIVTAVLPMLRRRTASLVLSFFFTLAPILSETITGQILSVIFFSPPNSMCHFEPHKI